MMYQKNLETYYDVDTMKKFYQFLNFGRFQSLSLERMKEIDEIATTYKNKITAKYKIECQLWV